MKSIRKRKLAELNGLSYKKLGLEYKGLSGYEDTYELIDKSSYGSIGVMVRKPYTKNFMEELQFMKELNIQNGVIID